MGKAFLMNGFFLPFYKKNKKNKTGKFVSLNKNSNLAGKI